VIVGSLSMQTLLPETRDQPERAFFRTEIAIVVFPPLRNLSTITGGFAEESSPTREKHYCDGQHIPTHTEGLNSNSGATNSEYDVLTITIPNTSFAVLSGGAATISLSLEGPGLGVLGTTPSNGAGLVFSTLSLDTASPPPEPSFVALIPMALGAFAFFRRRRHAR
jgi:hypothetical protein